MALAWYTPVAAAAHPTLGGRQLLGGWHPGTEALQGGREHLVSLLSLGSKACGKIMIFPSLPSEGPRLLCAMYATKLQAITSVLYRTYYAQHFYSKHHHLRNTYIMEELEEEIAE